MLRWLWLSWQNRHFVQGEHYQVEVKGRWWSYTARKDARVSAVLLDFSFEQAQEHARSKCRDLLLYGDTYTRKHFAPDEWPYPDEDPPDPL